MLDNLWHLDLNWWNSARKLFEVWEPWWSRQLQRRHRNAQVPLAEGESSSSAPVCIHNSAGDHPWSRLHKFCRLDKERWGGVLLDNKRVFGPEVNENMINKNFPLLISKSIELQALRSKSNKEIELLRSLKDDERIAELLPKTISKKTQNMNLKPLLLILGHMFRKPEVKDPIFAESMDELLKLTP